MMLVSGGGIRRRPVKNGLGVADLATLSDLQWRRVL
jgi:hypothetical protein